MADQYVASFVKVTEEVPAWVEKQTKTEIAVAAQDQYGEEFAIENADNVTVTGTLNGMPLSTTESSKEIEYKDGNVTVTKELKQDDVLEFTLTNTKGDKELAKTPFTYTVIKGEASVVDSVTLKADKTSVAAGEKIVFTADVRNQYKSPVTGEQVRWVVNGKVQDQNAQTFTLDAKEPGEYKVQVFSTTNSKKQAEKTVTVGAAALKTLAVEALTVPEQKEVKSSDYNNEAHVIGKLEVNKGAALLPENVKFHVTTTGEGLTKDDIEVTAEKVTVGKDADAKEIIVVKAVTSKAGTYKVTPFVGEEFTAKEVIPATEQTVTTTINTKVASISDITFDAKELKVGQEVKKEIVFKNKHGEVLTKEQAKAKVSATGDVFGNLENAIQQGTKATNDADKTYLVLKADKAGKTQVTVQSGDVLKSYTLEYKGAELTKVTAGADVTGVVAGDRGVNTDHNEKAKYNELTFLDQDGKAFKLDKDAKITLEATGKDKDGKKLESVTVADFATLGTFTPAKDDKTPAEFKGATKPNNSDASHVQILPATNVVEGTYKVTVKVAQGEKEATASFNVEVGAERAAKTVELKTEQTTVVLNGKTTTMITVKDQYGALVSDAKDNIEVVANNQNVTVGAVTEVKKSEIDKTVKADSTEDTVVGYKVELTGKAKGTSEITVNVKGEDAKTVLATAKQSITVDAADKLIDSVEIKDVENLSSGSEGGLTNEQLEAEVKDASGNVIAVDPEELSWKIKSVKDAKGNVLTIGKGGAVTGPAGVVIPADAKVELSKDGKLTVSEGLTVEVEVTVETQNFKSDTKVISVNGEAPKYVSGLKVATVNTQKDFENEGLEVVTNDLGVVTFTFTGVDQYDADFPIVDGIAANSGDDSALKVSVDTTTDAKGTVTVKAESAEGGNVYVKVGNDILTIKVAVSDEYKKTLEQK